MTLEQEIQAAIATLNKLPGVVRENRKRITDEGGRTLAAALALAAPHGDKPHYRYNTPKVARHIRAPKGSGKIVATYLPGNLEGSIKILDFNRAKSSTWVGARLSKGSSTGVFGNGRYDGYYTGMVVGGTKFTPARDFWRPTINSLTPQILRQMLADWLRVVEKFGVQNQVE